MPGLLPSHTLFLSEIMNEKVESERTNNHSSRAVITTPYFSVYSILFCAFASSFCSLIAFFKTTAILPCSPLCGWGKRAGRGENCACALRPHAASGRSESGHGSWPGRLTCGPRSAAAVLAASWPPPGSRKSWLLRPEGPGSFLPHTSAAWSAEAGTSGTGWRSLTACWSQSSQTSYWTQI